MKGRAKTYDEGLKKLKTLRIESSVFTADSEESDSEVKIQFQNQMKRMHLLRETEQLKQGILGQGKNNLERELQNDNSLTQENDLMNEKMKTADKSLSLSMETLIDAPHDFIISPSLVVAETSSNETNTCATVSDGLSIVQESVNNIVAPVLQLDNIKCKSEFETAVLCYLKKLSMESAQLSAEVQTLKEQNKNIISFLTNKNIVDLVDKPINYDKSYNIEVPIKTLENFHQFEKLLITNQLLRSCLLMFVLI